MKPLVKTWSKALVFYIFYEIIPGWMAFKHVQYQVESFDRFTTFCFHVTCFGKLKVLGLADACGKHNLGQVHLLADSIIGSFLMLTKGSFFQTNTLRTLMWQLWGGMYYYINNINERIFKLLSITWPLSWLFLTYTMSYKLLWYVHLSTVIFRITYIIFHQ